MSKQSITICSIGDLMICDSPLFVSVGVGSRYALTTDVLYKHVKEVFQASDIAMGNFETVVYEAKNKTLVENQMRCPEKAIEDLRASGVDVLNLANNHSLQHGTKGFENTRKACLENNIHPIGIRNEEVYTVETGGGKVAFLSLCIHLEWYQPENILYETDIEKILCSVRELRESDPILAIVVSVHWGDEFATYPSNAQIALAHKLADYGANVILGHHSHVYQGIENYNGAVIAYSQGNFISDMVPEVSRQTGVLNVTLNIDKDGQAIRSSYELSSYRIGEDYIPVPCESDWFDERQEELALALSGRYSDDDYWKNVGKNHVAAHNAFKGFFMSHLSQYRLRVLCKMVFDFGIRKVRRLTGKSTDGRVSSMDRCIMESITSAQQVLNAEAVGESCGEKIV